MEGMEGAWHPERRRLTGASPKDRKYRHPPKKEEEQTKVASSLALAALAWPPFSSRAGIPSVALAPLA